METNFPMLRSEVEFIRMVVKEYKPENRLEEKDKQNVLVVLEEIDKGHLVGLPEKQREELN